MDYSTWGVSWGDSWGKSWGNDAAPPPQPPAPADTFDWQRAMRTPVGRYAADPAISRMAQRMLHNRRR